MVSLLKLYTPPTSEPIQCILLCIPWAGGNGAYFKSWLPIILSIGPFKHIQLLALNLAGRSGTDKSIIHSMEVSGC